MLLSITSDNSRLPEAFTANTYQKFPLHQRDTLNPEERRAASCVCGRRLVAAQGLGVQILACATVCSPNRVCVVSRFNILTHLLTFISGGVTEVKTCMFESDQTICENVTFYRLNN